MDKHLKRLPSYIYIFSRDVKHVVSGRVRLRVEYKRVRNPHH